MDKPDNPYDPESVIGKLYDGDWRRCTVSQIAQSLHCCDQLVRQYIRKIKKEHGYCVQHMRIYNFAEKKREAAKIVLPPSYRPKREIIPRNCDTCWNVDCSFLEKRKFVTWTNCGEYMSEPEEVQES